MQTEDATKGKRGINRPEPLSPLMSKQHANHGIRKGRTDRSAEEVATLLHDVAEGTKWRPQA